MQKPAIVPATLMPTSRDFYQPPTIQSDFTKQLNTDHPHFTETFSQVRDWNAYVESGKEDFIWLRAAYFPVDWKSKVGNSDASANFKTDWNIQINKGDIVIRESGELLMLTWDIKEHMNNQATQAQLCNLPLTLKRHIAATSDNRGFVQEPAHDEIILDSFPATLTTYAGRPDYQPSSGIPGVNADSLMTGQIQFNSATKQMTINDEFEFGGFTYRVINVEWTEVNYAQTHGIINFNCKRVAGGMYAI